MKNTRVLRQKTILGALFTAAFAVACAGTADGPLGASKKALSVVQLSISGPDTLNIGDVQQYTATATYDDGTTADLTVSETWSASDPSLASVASDPAGQVTALAAGQVVISALDESGVGASLTITIVDPAAVPAPQLVEVDISGPSTLTVGDVLQYSAIGRYDDGSTADLTLSASWNSSDPSIAFVDSDISGLITAAAEGQLVLTAEDSSGVSGSLTVTVRVPADQRPIPDPNFQTEPL